MDTRHWLLTYRGYQRIDLQVRIVHGPWRGRKNSLPIKKPETGCECGSSLYIEGWAARSDRKYLGGDVRARRRALLPLGRQRHHRTKASRRSTASAFGQTPLGA